ncbi:MAG: hypothetical protein JXB19_09695 [Bacteroidales bacterium]|nr:hypothetical protein [Bacteroidales bacterium]
MLSSGTKVSEANKERFVTLLPFFAFFLVLFALTAFNPFFLDKDILFSKIAFWLPENGFSPVLPDSLDPGYPSMLAYVLALGWQITGKSLFLSHVIILPFTIGILWQIHVFLSTCVPKNSIGLAMIIILADSTFLAQTTVFSSDIVMLFFLLLGINSVIKNRRGILALAAFGLLFSHMRGVPMVIILFIFDIYKFRSKRTFKSMIKLTGTYVPAVLVFLSWMIFHHITKGWTGYHEHSPWIGCFETVNFEGFLRNILILVWRMLDFGKIFLWIAGFYLLVNKQHKHTLNDTSFRDLALLLCLTILATIPTMLIFKILNGHRYLMAVNLFLSFTVAYLILTKLQSQKLKWIFTLVITAGLISGNFWVYPDKIAKGWDASLAYLPYHQLRKQMIRHIEEHDIPFEYIGTESPNTITFKYIDASNDERSFGRADPEKDRYIFYSNIFNMFTNEEIDMLAKEWIMEKEYRRMQVYVRLYRNPQWD